MHPSMIAGFQSELVKIAAEVPHLLHEDSIPMEARKQMYENYLKEHSSEPHKDPSRSARTGSMWGGGIGGVGGLMVGGALGHPLAGAAVGGIGGALLGQGAGHASAEGHNSAITEAGNKLRSGKLDEHLMNEIVSQKFEKHKEEEEARRKKDEEWDDQWNNRRSRHSSF